MQRSPSQSEIDILSPYSSCDVSDALGQLGYPCLLQNIQLLSPNPSLIVGQATRVCGPAYTLEYVPLSVNSPTIPGHPVDDCPKGSVIVIKSPSHLPNAVWGGLTSARASFLGAQGVVVQGNVRDLMECQELGFPVFASGKSTLGASGYARVGSVGDALRLCDDTLWPVLVKTGDLILGDINGVVCIPIDRVTQVAQLCAKLTMADEHCMEDVKIGKSLAQAFKEHRGK